MSLAQDFRAFILRGNVVDLAVGVTIGGAFTAIVTAFVKDIITPLIAIPFGDPKHPFNFNGLNFHVRASKFDIGDFINTVVAFLIIAVVIFFLVVQPVNYLMSRRKTETPVDPTTRECPRCLSSIPVAATRCAFCTSDVEAA